jgi:hypothetical protein
MMIAITTPGVYVETVDPPAVLDPVAVDVVAVLGVFERGPLNTPVRIASWPQFQATFGDFIANGIGAYALKAWVDNGGRVAWVVRIAAPQHLSGPLGAQPADRRSSFLDRLDGLVPGAAAAIQQGTGTWLYLVAAVDAVTGRVSWDRPLHPEIDITLPFTVLTGANAAGCGLADDGAIPVLTVSASSPGAWGNELTVLIDARYGAATVSRAVASPGAAATAVETCDGFTAPTLVRISQDSGATVLTERRVIVAIDPGAPLLQWDSPLAVIDPTKPMRIEAETFALSIAQRGELIETWDQLSLVAGNVNYAPEVLQGSALVRAAIAPAAPPPPASGSPAPTGWTRLAGGLDGTAALAIADLLGGDTDPRGLASLAAVDEPAIVCAPDLVAEPVAPRIELPPVVLTDPCPPCQPPPPRPDQQLAEIIEASAAFSDDDVATAQQAMIDDCETRGDRIVLLDPPCGQGPLDVPALVTWRTRFDSTYAAMYAPWVTVLDPLASDPSQGPLPWGTMRRLPACAHIAGLMAAVDNDTGPWHAPANRLLSWVHQTDLAIDDAGHGRLNVAGVDVVRALQSRGVSVLGARTVSSDPSWLFISTRRLFLELERTLRVGLAWTVFEPASERLERTMVAAIGGLLEDLFNRGAFGGDSSRTSFYVQAGDGDLGNGEVVVEIGIVPAPPIEVIVLQVMRSENQLELREAPRRSA